MSRTGPAWAVLAAIALTTASAHAQTNDLDDTGALRRPGLTVPERALNPDLTAQGNQAPETETVHRRHPVRAVLQAGLAFALNVGWYWWDASFNSADWELGWDWKSWKKKLVTFEAVRLDSNHFRTNAGSHTEGGTLIYLIGRGNGLGPAGSMLLAFGEVVLWEYIGEFAEKPSINDLINNPVGGFAVGEPFYQLSEFFSHGADNGVNQTLATIFSPISAVNAWGDHQRPRRARDIDALGLSRDVVHRFDLFSGVSNARWDDGTERTESTLGLGTQLNTVRGYGRPFPRAGFFGTGRMTRIDTGLSLAHEGMTASLFATRVSLFGYHAQDLRLDDENHLLGNNLVLSLVNTFDYSSRARPGLPLDQIATFGIGGPSVDYTRRDGAMELTVHLEALPELGMVTALPADQYRERFGRDGLKSELAEHGYYYAYGLELGSQLAMRYHALEGGLEARWERFGSIEGVDRYQERLTRDFHQEDGRSRTAAWLGLRPVDGFVDLRLGVEHTGRFGQMGDLRVARGERRAMLTLGFVL
jgi:hypothetical protein